MEKEYLIDAGNGLELVESEIVPSFGIEVPIGAEIAILEPSDVYTFYKDGGKCTFDGAWSDCAEYGYLTADEYLQRHKDTKIIWQRKNHKHEQGLEMEKEYLINAVHGLKLVKAKGVPLGAICEIPDGAEIAILSGNDKHYFYKDNGGTLFQFGGWRDCAEYKYLTVDGFLQIWTDSKIIWERNEKTDAVNPSHYKNGTIECISAIESATVNKAGLEAVCTANVIKYLWRYESKNGLEDIKKARWYLDKLIEHIESN